MTAIPELTLHDECDQCGSVSHAQAWVRIRLLNGKCLDLCGHHFTENEAAFMSAGYRILDRRWELKPSMSTAEPHTDVVVNSND